MSKELKTIPQGKKGKKNVSHGTSPHLSLSTTVEAAVTTLQNTAVLVTTEAKGSKLASTRVEYPPELLAAYRGLFPSGRTYDFVIHNTGTLATTGAGSLLTGISWSPAAITYSEWAALSALFDEVKLVSSHIDITSAFGPTSSSIIFQVVIAPDPDATAASFTAIDRLAESEVFHCYNMSTTPGRFSKKYKVAPSRPYALTGTPAGSAGTPAGCLGQWGLANNIAGTVSINYLFYALYNRVRLRIRA